MKWMWYLLLVLTVVSCNTKKEQLGVLTAAGVSEELAQFRSKEYSNVKYNLSFDIPNNKKESVTGEARISWSQTGEQPLVIDFRGDASQVTSLLMNGAKVDYEVKNEHIYIAASHTRVGENEVWIAFGASNQSLNRRDEFLYTLLVPDRARTLFPCFDQPDLKANYTLSLIIPNSWKAVANGKIEHVDSLSHAEKHIVSFKETEPLPTYLFSFVAGQLQEETFSRDGRSVAIYHRETDEKRIAQCAVIADEVFDALAWMEGFTQVPYPFAKYDLIILPGFQYGGMEHTGATLYNDQRMFLNEQPTLVEQLGRSSLIAHETAHMWFGDYVTMRWFNDVWTKEVFANYFAARMVEPLYPTINHQLNFIRGYIPSAYSEDRTQGTTPIQQELDNLNNAGLVYCNIIYNKSPVMMEMLVQRMGQQAFRSGIQDYLHTYAYGNATWDELIASLSKYSERDVKSFSEVWVKEKGMPVLQAKVEDGKLVVEQSDSWDRGLIWPQQMKYRLIEDGIVEDVLIEMDESSPIARTQLKHKFSSPVILPNIDGRGYGFFKMEANNMEGVFAYLDTDTDDLLKGSLLITLNENLQHHTVDVDAYLHSLMNYLAHEESDLLYTMALGYVGSGVRFTHSDYNWLEKELWKQVEEGKKPQFRLQAFRQLMNIANSEASVSKMYQIWKNQDTFTGIDLSERDMINLSYQLAVHLPDKADSIVEEQLARISNSDRREEYLFISPAVSSNKIVRDRVFNALLMADNRSVEPWASSALSLLNHRLREKEALGYIRAGLGALEEVQQTGDIFFPTAWLRSLLSGHTSVEARQEIEAFWEEHPNYSLMLSNKIWQQADHLYRLNVE
jgi:aminopeptidase N